MDCASVHQSSKVKEYGRCRDLELNLRFKNDVMKETRGLPDARHNRIGRDILGSLGYIFDLNVQRYLTILVSGPYVKMARAVVRRWCVAKGDWSWRLTMERIFSPAVSLIGVAHNL